MEVGLYTALFLIVTAIQSSAPLRYRSNDDSTEEVEIILGGLFPVHGVNNDGSCGKIQGYGLQRLEAMALAVKMVNNDSTLLSDLHLGFDIRDTCSQSNLALQSSLDFIVGLDNNGLDNSSRTTGVAGISGVVGSASSSESISAASLLRLFQTPQISYASTARILSDKTRYGYFFRTLPPDVFQARVMVELVLYYNWTYVIAINSDDVYGQDGIAAFVNELQSISITNNRSSACQHYCVVADPIAIPLTASEVDYDNVIQQINQPWFANSSVIVLFGQPATIEGILNAIDKYNDHRPMTFIVSDGAGDNLPFKYYKLAHGMISVLPEYKESQEFNNYFTSLKPSNNDNPWFTEYWESVFNCSFNTLKPNDKERCNEAQQKLSSSSVGYTQNSKVPFVLDAVYAFAHAIHNMLSTVCGNITICDKVRVERYGRYVINGQLLRQYLHNVSFNGFSANRIEFDENGDQPGGYWINNLQDVSDTFQFVRLTEWKEGNELGEQSKNLSLVQWGPDYDSGELPISFCSHLCSAGYEPVTVRGQASCCWTCEKCQNYREVSNGLVCFECEQGFSPNHNASSCQENPLSYLRWDDPASVLILLITTTGMVCTAIVIGVFTVFNKHTVIKASSRELSAVLLIGIFLCFLIPFFSIGRPSLITCALYRFFFGFSFSLCYAALLVKTNRIHRIFNRKLSKSNQRPALISPQIQIFFTLILVFVQIVITVAWLVVEQPGTEYIYHDESTELTCSFNPYIAVIISLGYNLMLLLVSTYFAFRTRKIPQNFNETKFINFTLYSVIVIWLAFIPAYIAISTVQLGSTFTTVCQLFAIVLSALTTLVSLFFSKLYFIFSAKKKESTVLGEQSITVTTVMGTLKNEKRGDKATAAENNCMP